MHASCFPPPQTAPAAGHILPPREDTPLLSQSCLLAISGSTLRCLLTSNATGKVLLARFRNADGHVAVKREVSRHKTGPPPPLCGSYMPYNHPKANVGS